MDDVKAIPLQGINHHVDKINVVDGMCEDIVNIRFKDGSWRTTGEGTVINEDNAIEYRQVFIHTNVYRHMLGVKDNQLWWFGNLIPKDNNASIEKESFNFVEISPVSIAPVDGDLFIQQSGHLLSVVCVRNDEEDNRTFIRLVYKTNSKEYKLIEFDENGKQDDRVLFPYGNVHVNLNISEENSVTSVYDSEVDSWGDEIYVDGEDDLDDAKTSKVYTKPDVWHSMMIEAFGKARKKNLITGPCFIVLALKLYDGTYACASNPIFVNPCEAISSGKFGYVPVWGTTNTSYKEISVPEDDCVYMPSGYVISVGERKGDNWTDPLWIANKVSYKKSSKWSGVCANLPVYSSSAYGVAPVGVGGVDRSGKSGGIITKIQGANLIVSGDFSDIVNNDETFVGVGVFISKIENYLDTTNSKDNYGDVHKQCKQYAKNTVQAGLIGNDFFVNFTYEPKRRDMVDIIDSICSSPFNLLYDISIGELSKKTINIDLSEEKYEGLLDAISSAPTLLSTAQSRSTYIPKVAYMYNGRSHIANYKTKQFHGYPVDVLHLNNHSVKISSDGFFKNTIPGVVDSQDSELQFHRNEIRPIFDNILVAKGAPVIIARVTIKTSDGDQIVSRFISAYPNSTMEQGGLPNFIEDVGPLLSFPDRRANKIELMQLEAHGSGRYKVLYREFELKPHPYINLSYYIDGKLKPIRWADINDYYEIEGSMFLTAEQIQTIVDEKNIEESYPNGLKVSKTNNPLYFPAANTYQVGSSEIVALASNAIAVGTGQTGAAPLYVFCKDGIYALFVDSSGEMAYTNSRVIARDVCNNAKSVTPIDAGVVFTTDRGLMMIAGEQVNEIGQPLEGDFEQITPSMDLIGKGYALQKLAGLPADSVTSVPFLVYLKGAIINNNHNEHELMVSNPNYNYTYVLDRDKNWTRRNFTADEYVQNYPTSYRLTYGDRLLRQVDNDSDADNGMFVLTRELKLDSIGFKELHRVVARGWFEVPHEGQYLDLYVQGSYDARRWATLGVQRRKGKFTDIGALVERTDCRYFRFVLSGKLTKHSRLDYFEVSSRGSAINSKIR